MLMARVVRVGCASPRNVGREEVGTGVTADVGSRHRNAVDVALR